MDQIVARGCDSDWIKTVDVDDIPGIVARAVEAIGQMETVPLRRAAGRVLHCDMHSGMALPSFDHSAVDGFGFRGADLNDGPTSLPVSGRVLAGDRPSRLRKHTAVRLMTGAPIPAGCDAVLKHEHAGLRDGHVIVHDPVPSGTNIRRVGEDVGIGDLLVRRGTVLDARHVALLAACGVRNVPAVRRIRIAMVAFGNELRKPGSTLRPGQIFDSNTPMATAFVSRPWTHLVECVQIGDKRARAAELLKDLSADCDLIVTSGGMACGDEDHTRLALEQAGGSWQPLAIRMKPGKPSGLGRIGSTIVLGLPGNAFAALVGLVVLGFPVLSRLAGAHNPLCWLPVLSDFHLTRRPGRTELFPARLCGSDKHGAIKVERLGNGGSARLQPLMDADGLARIEADIDVITPGDRLAYLPFSQLFG